MSASYAIATQLRAAETLRMHSPKTEPKSNFYQVREHLAYLKRVSTQGTPPLITTETATQARRAWWAVWEATGFALPVPAASSGPDGEMFYSWDRGWHHLELEIIPGQPAEFFYRNRVTGELWGADYIIGDPIPVDAINKLKLFIRGSLLPPQPIDRFRGKYQGGP